jgi:nucleoside-diphosphate-sugar epimerase
MRITLTGATGYIGSALTGQLLEAGHDVTALVREGSAGKVARGATPAAGDLTDVDWVARQFAAADAVAHLAAPGDGSDEAFDSGVVAAAIAALGGTGKPYVHTGGIWVWGTNPAVTEQSPVNPPALTAWRLGPEQVVRESTLASTIVAPGIVYGAGTGIPATAFGRAPDGRTLLVGDGSQHWAVVHTDDIATLYRLVLEHGEPLGDLIGATAENPAVRALGEARGDVVAEGADASRERLGAAFADALLLDQQNASTKAADVLGWKPVAPTLLEEFRSGSYAR